ALSAKNHFFASKDTHFFLSANLFGGGNYQQVVKTTLLWRMARYRRQNITPKILFCIYHLPPPRRGNNHRKTKKLPPPRREFYATNYI
ncbi:MAG: hypothetical protein IIW91_08520, partial [Alistipes sp.]|nr:hypothetical protein [Alistipes sp.]